jgi:N-acetyl-anhydromuramyl-L-alanine amidase AmpD
VPAPAVGVCLVGDFSKAGPAAEEQTQALVKLVTDLQRQFKIPKERVYLYWTISASNKSPGAAFPEKEFNKALLAIN